MITSKNISLFLATISAALLLLVNTIESPVVYRFHSSPESTDYVSIFLWISLSLFGLKFTYIPQIIRPLKTPPDFNTFIKNEGIYFMLFLFFSFFLVLKISDPLAVSLNSDSPVQTIMNVEVLKDSFKLKLTSRNRVETIITQVCRSTYQKVRDTEIKELEVERGRSFGLEYVKTPCF